MRDDYIGRIHSGNPAHLPSSSSRRRCPAGIRDCGDETTSYAGYRIFMRHAIHPINLHVRECRRVFRGVRGTPSDYRGPDRHQGGRVIGDEGPDGRFGPARSRHPAIS
jgi:hypothetical protein